MLLILDHLHQLEVMVNIENCVKIDVENLKSALDYVMRIYFDIVVNSNFVLIFITNFGLKTGDEIARYKQ